MPSPINITIHPSQFPENVWRELLESLRRREINHKFHYDSVKQTQKWLALHQAYSPSRNDPDCLAIYDRSFDSMSRLITSRRACVIGLGCGGGQKDARLLKQLKASGNEVFYSPGDVSSAMVLVASQAVSDVVRADHCFPFVCDLAAEENLAGWFETQTASEIPRILTFFGMIPNFEPQAIFPKLLSLVRPGDHLLFSANLASEAEYATGLTRILAQYDNPLTRDWLMTFLSDLGIESGDGELRFAVEAAPSGIRRITAWYAFSSKRRIQVGSEQFEFRAGESVRLFFSCRYTVSLIRSLLNQHGLKVHDQWITRSEEEGVFLCSRS